MNANIETGIEGIHYFEKMPSGLKTAQEMADNERVFIDADRLIELADSQLIPHWRVAEGEPLFQVSEVRRWVARNLLERCEGATTEALRIEVVYQGLEEDWTQPPDAISGIDNLKMMHLSARSGIYFLCEQNEVVYVGQSVVPSARVAYHKEDGKLFDTVFLLPCPRSEMNLVESKLIHALKPRYNGNTGKHKTAPVGEEVCKTKKAKINLSSVKGVAA